MSISEKAQNTSTGTIQTSVAIYQIAPFRFTSLTTLAVSAAARRFTVATHPVRKAIALSVHTISL
jgi:hypothetical protein